MPVPSFFPEQDMGTNLYTPIARKNLRVKLLVEVIYGRMSQVVRPTEDDPCHTLSIASTEPLRSHAPTSPNVEQLNSDLQQQRDENHRLSLELASLRRECESLRREAGSATAINDSQPPLLWKGCASLPSGFVRPHVVVRGTSVFVGGGNGATLETSRTVFRYCTERDAWSGLPIAPQYTFALVALRGAVTAVGGVSVISSTLTGALASFDEKTQKWGRKFPAVPTGRCACSTAASDSHLVVVGGLAGKTQSYTNAVEILDLSTLVWSTAAPTPIPLTFMSIALCPVSGRLYLTGGLTEQGAVRSVFSCLLDGLLLSSQEDHTSGTEASHDANVVWETITDAPYVRSGCAVVDGRLVTASGLDGDQKTTTCLHVFDSEANSWSQVGVMPAARSSCSIAVLSSTRVIVVGGYVDPRNWTRSLTTDVMECVNLQL